MFSRAIIIALWAFALSGTQARAAEPFINILTGGTGGVYYVLGVALAKDIGKVMPGLKSSVQATKGSSENLTLLQAERGELAFALGDSLSAAWKGDDEAGFKTPLKRLRGIAALYPNYIQIVARADSGIRTLADLKGKVVSVGTAKSTAELNARAIFAAAGLSYRAFSKVEYLPFGESIELLKSGQIDVTLQSAALGLLALRDLAASFDIVVVPIPVDIVKNINDPAFLPGTIPANTYRGQTSDVPSAVVRNYLVTQEAVGSDLIYTATKALWTGLDELVASHAAAKAIDPKLALEGMPVPLHPGAEKYYREIGLLK